MNTETKDLKTTHLVHLKETPPGRPTDLPSPDHSHSRWCPALQSTALLGCQDTLQGSHGAPSPSHSFPLMRRVSSLPTHFYPWSLLAWLGFSLCYHLKDMEKFSGSTVSSVSSQMWNPTAGSAHLEWPALEPLGSSQSECSIETYTGPWGLDRAGRSGRAFWNSLRGRHRHVFPSQKPWGKQEEPVMGANRFPSPETM